MIWPLWPRQCGIVIKRGRIDRHLHHDGAVPLCRPRAPVTYSRVEHFVTFEKLAITSKILRIPMEDIDSIYSLEFELSFGFISPVRILDILKAIAKTSFSKISK